jgi:hypothetical protein
VNADQALKLITQSGNDTRTHFFLLQANDRRDRIDSFYPLDNGSLLRMPRTSKSFKLPNFLAPRSRARITQVVETEMHLFSWEINHHTVTCCAYKAERC